MPQAIALAIVPLITSAATVGAIGFTGVATLALGIGYAVTAAGLYLGAVLLGQLFNPAQSVQPELPKPEDGKFNLKQPVPPLTYVLGRTKKGGDYVFLEEKNGVAYHVTVLAGHRINQIVSIYLHDEQVTLDGSGVVTSPAHFGSNVVVQTRLGVNAETAYAPLVSIFGGDNIWTANHRGDGIASLMMSAATVAPESYHDVYPQQMPQPTAVIDGALLYDPRTATTAFSTNLALMRLWHLTSPIGGKLALADLYLPDWQNAANVCDGSVTNRNGGSESRYHGGLWFRASDDPVAVGRTIDQAGELVIYERPDGKIGVHAGEYVAPDIRLDAKDIHSVQLDSNRRQSTNVVAVRGRWTDPANGFTTVDAAIYGDPYETSDERTRTLENPAVQSHNHMARLQKLAYIRANAPRVSVSAAYGENTKQIRTRRFVKVHYPPRLDEAVIELTGRVTLSLKNMTVTFEGIVVPPTLYDFNAATEEGAPGSEIVAVTHTGVPNPEDFNATIATEIISGGATAAYGAATWTHVSDALVYEFEWERTDVSSTKQSTLSTAGEDATRSTYLVDGGTYRFRLRAWSNGASSDWTDYQTLIAVANPTAPGDVIIGTLDTATAGEVTIPWTAPNDTNYYGARIFFNSTNDFGSASEDTPPEYGPYGALDVRTISDLTAGDWYAWVQAINSSGVRGTAVATGVFTVT